MWKRLRRIKKNGRKRRGECRGDGSEENYMRGDEDRRREEER